MSKEFNTVRELINDIAINCSKSSVNTKDEVKIATAMLNDPTYVVDIYDKNGVSGTYCPYKSARIITSNIIKSTMRVEDEKAHDLANKYKFSKEDAKEMVNLSKEFINTYLDTGHKLSLGTREKSNVSLLKLTKEAKTNNVPTPVVDANGQKSFQFIKSSTPEYNTIKVFGKCPSHLKNKEEKNK